MLLRGERARRAAAWARIGFDRPVPRGLGLALAAGLLLAATVFGAVRGGQYQAFVEREGSLGDVIARVLGFGVNTVTISGQSRLSESQVLAIAGISPNDSLPFFDAEAARARLEKTPLIKQASVRKLYPGQIVIDMVERTPAALWQRDGEVRTVAADGAVIDELRDARLGRPALRRRRRRQRKTAGIHLAALGDAGTAAQYRRGRAGRRPALEFADEVGSRRQAARDRPARARSRRC